MQAVLFIGMVRAAPSVRPWASALGCSAPQRCPGRGHQQRREAPLGVRVLQVSTQPGIPSSSAWNPPAWALAWPVSLRVSPG